MTGSGGEGMVVKPFANLTRTKRGLAQPGIKVRGREYLRIIYGPDYTEPRHLDRLRDRNLGHKRSLALREYALGSRSPREVRRRRAPVARPRSGLRRSRPRVGTGRPPGCSDSPDASSVKRPGQGPVVRRVQALLSDAKLRMS
jgi:hypothetical protein